MVEIAMTTTDLNGREMESEGCNGPILFKHSFSTFSNSTNLELAGHTFPLGLTGSTDQWKSQNVDTSIFMSSSKVQAVVLQEMAADETVIVKVRNSPARLKRGKKKSLFLANSYSVK